MKIEYITSYENLLNYIKNYKYIFINISANWCKPCNELKPHLEKFISVINENNIIYLKLNHSVYDDDDSFQFFFGMKKIPYFGYLKDGILVDSFVSGDFTFVSKRIFDHITKIKLQENSTEKESSKLDISTDF